MSDDRFNEIVFESIAAANAATPKCPKPKGGQHDHWWYLDYETHSEAWHNREENWHKVPCVCGTCGQKMMLSINSPELPAV